MTLPNAPIGLDLKKASDLFRRFIDIPYTGKPMMAVMMMMMILMMMMMMMIIMMMPVMMLVLPSEPPPSSEQGQGRSAFYTEPAPKVWGR
jgi:hypothetical protein